MLTEYGWDLKIQVTPMSSAYKRSLLMEDLIKI